MKQGGRVLEGEDPAEAAEGVIADGNADGGDGENAVAFQEHENVAAQEEERGFANDNENVPQDQIDAPAKEWLSRGLRTIVKDDVNSLILLDNIIGE